MDQRELSYEELDSIAGAMPVDLPPGDSYRPDALAGGSYRQAHPEGVVTCLRCQVYVHLRKEKEPTCWCCGLDDELSKFRIHIDMPLFRGATLEQLMTYNPEGHEPEGL